MNNGRSPRRELIQLAVVWGVAYVLSGWLAWDAIETGKGVKLCFFLFFFLTPFFAIFGYLGIKDAWRGLSVQESDWMAAPALAFIGACYVIYKFLI